MAIHLGDTAPDFTAETTQGTIRFHEWLGDSWGIIFSHPADFTPVCTTELGAVARIREEFDRRKVKPIVGLGLSNEEARKRFPRGFKELRPYLRLTPQPNR